VADEAYLTESMMDPGARVVAGNANIMPTFRGRLAGPEAAALVEFIKSLRADPPQDVPTQEPAHAPSR
jgi:cytochrome c oxidase subunit 2